MLSYTLKRVIRSLGLFAALLLGVILASTFFTGVNVGADTTAKAALNQQLDRVPVDIIIDGGYKYGSYGSQSDSASWINVSSRTGSVEGVARAEVISRASWFGNMTFANYTSFVVVGLSNASRVYRGLTVREGPDSLGTNETYIWTGSKNADKILLDSTLALEFEYQIFGSYPPNQYSVNISLKVVGSVELDDAAYAIALGELYGSPVIYHYEMNQLRPVVQENLLIVNWEKTFAKLLDTVPTSIPSNSSFPSYSSPFSVQVYAYVDRDKQINPWDIPGSLQNLRTITDRVNQEVAAYGLSAYNNLEQVLGQYQSTSVIMRIQFLVVALPVFFVAWYVGTTVSDVSYNLRRREIGLLLTKGFSNKQLFRMFLTESILIGLVGGLIGVGLGFLLSPLFAVFFGGGLGAAPVLSQEVIITAVVFSLVITLLSTFRPSRRASRLSAVDALKEYMYVEEVKPYKQRWPWIAFILGLYKIIIFLLGIDLYQMLMHGPMPFGNIFLAIVIGIWVLIDYYVLTYIGPLLFFWGFTKIFIRGSLKFQELVTRAARFLGDLGALATRNVRRNPARMASLAFLIALIVGYGFQTVGTLASVQDYIVREVKSEVGADISVQLASGINVSSTVSAIANISGIASTTVEYWFSASLPSQYSTTVQIRAIDPAEWPTIAYYESEWFSGNYAITAFGQMRTNNQTVILEKSTATNLDRKVGDSITMNFSGSTRQLTVAGFFGLEVPQKQYSQPYEYGGAGSWSYVPLGFYKSLPTSPYSSIRILVKLESNADEKSVVSAVRNLDKNNYVRSLAEELETYQSDLTRTGPLNIQRIGIIFSVLAASVATSLVTLVSLQERKRETSIMNARGLSFKQLVTMLLAESFAVVVFAVVLGAMVGMIVVRGNVAGLNAASSSIVAYRIVFPADAVILMSTCLILVFASTIIPLILLTKRYISRTERIVRL